MILFIHNILLRRYKRIRIKEDRKYSGEDYAYSRYYIQFSPSNKYPIWFTFLQQTKYLEIEVFSTTIYETALKEIESIKKVITDEQAEVKNEKTIYHDVQT